MSNTMCPVSRSQRSPRLPGLLALLAATAVTQAGSAEATFPGEHWQNKRPAELGLDAGRLDVVARALGGRGCVVQNGFVVKTWGSQSEKSDWYSSAKPVFSTLLFFAVHEGKVESVDTPVKQFGWELTGKNASITFRHLANMTSGYARPDAPGKAWAYNDFAIQLYQKTLFDRVFGEPPDSVANAPERLGFLQLEDGLTLREPKRRILASVRDFARIGWFWLNRGRWNGKQLLPESFFDEFMKPQAPKDLPHTAPGRTNDSLEIGSFGGGSDHFTKFGAGIYGFNWWYNDTGRLHPDSVTWPNAPADTIMTIGFGGNCMVMIPSLNVVVPAAKADWGSLQAGDAGAVMNQRLKLIVAAATPVADRETTNTRPDANQSAQFAQNGHDGRHKESDGNGIEQDVIVTGRMKKWHPVTLTFRGPETSEQATPNPFRDYRFDVTFTHAEKTYRVPGYFAADGRAAETSAEAGDRWRVHFVPDEAGEWQWSVSFRTGSDVAASLEPTRGDPVSLDGKSGSFSIDPVDPSDASPRSKGMLRYVNRRYLQFAETGEFFLKGGADSPENFLAYAEFDQTTPTHRYSPHAVDFQPGDPTWQNGKGKNIIGALNYLAGKGVNSVYFLTMNVRGDGKDVWPWTSGNERFRYDCSKLDQWEIVFSHMDRLGIMMHAITQETENDQLLDGGELGPERRIYYRELIARFAHHQAVTWNLGEENTNTHAQRKAFGDYFHALDVYDHPVVIHTYPGKYDEVYEPLLDSGAIDGVSLQTNDTHEQTIRWIGRSQSAGREWVVCLDEIGPASTGVKPDKDDPHHDRVRKEHLWGNLMAGGAGVEWYFGYKFAHHDLNLEDFRSRDHLWDLTRFARRFFIEHLPYERMQHADPLVRNSRAYCFSEPGRVYAVYLPDGGAAELNLEQSHARFDVRWYNPRSGGLLEAGTVPSIAGPGWQPLGHPPDDRNKDWAALVRLRDTPCYD